VNNAVAAKVPASSVFLNNRRILDRGLAFGRQTVTAVGWRSIGAIACDFAILCFVLDSDFTPTLKRDCGDDFELAFVAEDRASAIGSRSWGGVVMLSGV